MLRVDDLRQLPPVHHLLIDPHVDHGVEAVGGLHIVADDFSDGGSPVGTESSAVKAGWRVSPNHRAFTNQLEPDLHIQKEKGEHLSVCSDTE